MLVVRIGNGNVWVDPRTCKTTVRGGLEAAAALDTAINRSSRYHWKVKHPSTSLEYHCPVCLQRASKAVKLTCGHSYCDTCLHEYLASGTRYGGPYPLNCFGDAGQCKQPIHSRVFRLLLTPEELEAATTKAFEAHVQSHPEEFRYCPTPNCPQLYRIKRETNEKATIQCTGCLIKVCTACHCEDGHEGQTCQQRRDSRREAEELSSRELENWLLANGGKRCGKCSMALIKEEGCNHVQCGSCKAHMCWHCGQVFPEVGMESVYQHMNREHGGIHDPTPGPLSTHVTPTASTPGPSSSNPSTSAQPSSSISVPSISRNTSAAHPQASSSASSAKALPGKAVGGKHKGGQRKDPTWNPPHQRYGPRYSKFKWRANEERDERYQWDGYDEALDYDLDGSVCGD